MFSGKKKRKKSSNTVVISGPAITKTKTGPAAAKTKKVELHSSKRQVVELCEEMIDISRELEDIKAEYELVNLNLNDIQIIEGLTEGEREPIQKAASEVQKLGLVRSQFLESEHKLSDVQFAQLQEEEQEIPSAMKRLKSNETYLDAIKKDLNYLEGEKVEWDILRQGYLREQKVIRRTAGIVLVLAASGVVLLLLMKLLYHLDTQLLIMILAFLAVAFSAFSMLKYQDCNREIRRCDVNRNQATSLENHVKIKYVNIKNAVDYACEKYHVNNSYELTYLFEQYQESVKERESFRETNDNLLYYTEELVRLLERQMINDARAWIHYVNALLDEKEMLELKHDLRRRKKKLRSRMEYNVSILSDIKKEIGQYMKENRDATDQVRQFLSRIEEISQFGT